ncbi:Uncharacterized conserved protein YdeI, YjbR/CyaY-like superfamily, DUF1801 family [Sphingomonas guangdongensis]|uniref:Uncharacterized conserved protein YdeI, YjbR/CyaY-like superfamily, DUF1801 family n=1 Tax=Sphingomonas guangdongensis TaxID=1141890 RepID=A0A285QL60_9SPHN|nr:YdeI/OmpD-associated family protein [Sphingomonas guangdongensis]SOB80812.1 Uncharacterized conserved protein YdeI, YjbR/CyaY-like superfamily, DUF1801 family [Sphingomonas guangdongensis]
MTDPLVDAYIAAAAPFARPILGWLRARVHAACFDVTESIKWGRPFFSVAGRPLAGMAAFSAHASFRLWNGDGQFGRLITLGDLPDAATMEAMIAAAAAAAPRPRVNRVADGAAADAAVPPALAAALADDAVARATFDAFPPGQRREYCEWIGEAKRPETRDKRVVEAIAWLREGKRRNWKYERR